MNSTQVRIAVDATGGDYAPDEVVAGALRAKEELGVEILLVGDEAKIRASVAQPDLLKGVDIVPAEGTIEMHEEPISALRRKPKASINVSMDLVKKGRADGVVSAGHSGAAMAAALLRLGRIKGIDRPAIGAMFPTVVANKPVLILDVGANVDCKPKYLEQFAFMGSTYSRYVLGTESPKVGLLNIGEEKSKGNEVAVTVNKSLSEQDAINFVGNAEGRDVLSGDFDVIVCDGFVGNILLKFAEAVGSSVLQILREELPQGISGKVGCTLMKGNLKRVKQRVDHAERGGGLLLGVAGIAVISHGSSKSPSIFNAIRLAKDAVDNQVIDRIKSQYQKVAATAKAKGQP
ncbi:MAG: phosphate acyltransferase PlsX [Cyanobacteria bacterium P01_D01_bin.36]